MPLQGAELPLSPVPSTPSAPSSRPSFPPPREAVRRRCRHSELTWFLLVGRDPSYSTSFQLEGNTTHVREQFPMPVLL